MIDNCSNVTHLITHKNYIIPIVPEPIPIYKKYQYLYSFLDVQDIRVGMKVKFGPKHRYNGKVIKRPFRKRGKEVVSIKSDEGKIYSEIMCNSSFISQCKLLT